MTVSLEAVKQQEQIAQILSWVSVTYGLDKITAERALITAPFGQAYFDECVRHLSSSKALRQLSSKNKTLILIVTSKRTKVRPVSGVQIIQIDPISDWPAQESYQSRFIKWGIPLLFPNIRQSIYVDSDLRITNSAEKLMRLFEWVDQKRCVMTRHETRNGWEEECREIIKAQRFLDLRKIRDQREFYQKEGLPEDIPVFQTNFIGRVHGSEFDLLSACVLSQLMQHSERDQLALPSAMRLSGLSPYGSEEGQFLYSGFKSTFEAGSLCFVDGLVMGRFFMLCRNRAFRVSQELGRLEITLNKIFHVLGFPRF